jgi:hypothetical protein
MFDRSLTFIFAMPFFVMTFLISIGNIQDFLANKFLVWSGREREKGGQGIF